jgi:hypothetical protein
LGDSDKELQANDDGFTVPVNLHAEAWGQRGELLVAQSALQPASAPFTCPKIVTGPARVGFQAIV